MGLCGSKEVMTLAGTLMATVLGLPGQGPTTVKADAPRAHFAENTHDFGKVKNGEKQHHEFVVTNEGTATLEILEVKPGCGCTPAGAFDRHIPPGKTGKIPIEFNPINFAGPISKAITVTCNDPAQGTQLLTVKANVWREVDVNPAQVHFLPIEGEAVAETKVVRIVSNVEQPLTIEAPVGGHPALKTELKTVVAGKEYELRVTFDPELLPDPGKGPTQTLPPAGALSLKTSFATLPIVNVGTFVLVQAAVQATPAQIGFVTDGFGKEIRHTVMVRSLGKPPIQIRDAAVNVPGVAVETKEVTPGRLYQVNLVFPARFSAAELPAELTVGTDHAKYPLLRVPLTLTPPAVASTSPPTPPPASPPQPPADAPRAQFAETSFDFGTLKGVEKQSHEFTVTNTGKAPLEITDVKPDVGCSLARAWDRHIEPGKTGTIALEFTPVAFAGAVARRVTVTCNDPVQRSHSLQLKAYVWRPIDVTPAFVHFMPLEGEVAVDTKKVRIVSNVDEPVILKAAPLANPALKAELTTIVAGKEYELSVTFDPALMPASSSGSASPVAGLLRLETSNASMPEINISTYVMIQPTVQAIPKQIDLPAALIGKELRQTIMLRNLGNTIIKVTEAAVAAGGVVVETKELTPGKVFQLTLVFPATFCTADMPTELVVKTDHAKYPVLRVPVASTQAAKAAPPAGSK